MTSSRNIAEFIDLSQALELCSLLPLKRKKKLQVPPWREGVFEESPDLLPTKYFTISTLRNFCKSPRYA